MSKLLKNNKFDQPTHDSVNYRKILRDLDYSISDDLSLPSSSRVILRVKKNDQSGIAYFTNPKYQESKYRIIDEIEILKTIKLAKKNSYFPALHEYSEDQGWFIREEIDGHNAGNVYIFNENFLSDTTNLVELIKILQNLAEITPPKHRKLTAKDFITEVRKIKSVLPSNILKKAAIEKYLAEIEKSNKLFNQNLSFLHYDIQPTNLLLSSAGLKLIDFEKAQIGNKLFDFVSILHRLNKKESAQIMLIDLYKKMIGESDPLAVKLFSKYFLIIDIVSLYYSYVKKTSPPYHGTEINKTTATALMNLYIKKFNSIVII